MPVKAVQKRSSRSRLTPMRVSSHYRDYVIDQLSALPGLRAQAMFGGVGLYAGDVFFGILAADVLYFKVSDTTRLAYESAGSKPFKPYADRAMTMGYYEVPAEVLETPADAVQWARQAVGVASKAASIRARRTQAR